MNKDITGENLARCIGYEAAMDECRFNRDADKAIAVSVGVRAALRALEVRDAEIWRLEGIAKDLWCLLDDIDTAEDMFKPEITPHFNYVHKKHRDRFKYITSDGNELTIKAQEADNGIK